MFHSKILNIINAPVNTLQRPVCTVQKLWLCPRIFARHMFLHEFLRKQKLKQSLKNKALWGIVILALYEGKTEGRERGKINSKGVL